MCCLSVLSFAPVILRLASSVCAGSVCGLISVWLYQSELVNGFALNCTRASQQMPKRVQNAKIALLDIDLKKHRMQMGVSVLVNDPRELEAIRKREADITKERIQKILASGANVILTTKGIDDLCLKYFVEAKAIAVRRCKKEDLRRIARATGGTMMLTLADMENEGTEAFDSANLGEAEEVVEERVGDGECSGTVRVPLLLSAYCTECIRPFPRGSVHFISGL